MKNLRKALAAVIALSVMSWSCAAFAEISASGAFSGGNGAVTADYSEITQNKVTAEVDTGLATAGTEMTFLILDADTDVTDIDEGDILYIDQKTLTSVDNSFTGTINLARVNGGVGAETLPTGEYPIRVGYYYDNNGTQTFGLASATMIVADGGGSGETPTITIIWGDVDFSGEAKLSDTVDIVNALTGVKTTLETEIDGVEYVFTHDSSAVTVDGESYTMELDGEPFVWGDIDLSGEEKLSDTVDIVNALTGVKTTWADGAIEFDNDVVITLVK